MTRRNRPTKRRRRRILRLPQPEDVPRVLVRPNKLFYHGSDRKIRSAPPCSYFSKSKGQASGVIYGAYEEAARSRWVLIARLREPTVFLDVTGGFEESFIGDTAFRHVMSEFIHEVPNESTFAQAFCEHREVFPDCAGFYRERFGLLVAEPDEVMEYVDLVPAASRGHYWPGSRYRTNPNAVK